MMNMTLGILLIEISIVLFVIVAVLLFFKWKSKKQQANEFEQLLNAMSKAEQQRKTQLTQLLIESHALAEDKAKESAEYMIEAEKQFMQQFLKQQMEQTPLTGFYAKLCELLDQYLYFIPTVDAEQSSKDETKEVESQQSDNEKIADDQAETAEEQETLKEIESDRKDHTGGQKPEPEVIKEKQEEVAKGDAVAEASDKSDKATKEKPDAEEEKD